MVAEGYKEHYKWIDSIDSRYDSDRIRIDKYLCLRCEAKFYDMIGDYLYCPYCGKELVEREENE